MLTRTIALVLWSTPARLPRCAVAVSAALCCVARSASPAHISASTRPLTICQYTHTCMNHRSSN
eukprot:2299298-Pleurochrysis_carterae.AAC.1